MYNAFLIDVKFSEVHSDQIIPQDLLCSNLIGQVKVIRKEGAIEDLILIRLLMCKLILFYN